MQTKILKDRPTGGGKEKIGGGAIASPLPQSGYGPETIRETETANEEMVGDQLKFMLTWIL